MRSSRASPVALPLRDWGGDCSLPGHHRYRSSSAGEPRERPRGLVQSQAKQARLPLSALNMWLVESGEVRVAVGKQVCPSIVKTALLHPAGAAGVRRHAATARAGLLSGRGRSFAKSLRAEGRANGAELAEDRRRASGAIGSLSKCREGTTARLALAPQCCKLCEGARDRRCWLPVAGKACVARPSPHWRAAGSRADWLVWTSEGGPGRSGDRGCGRRISARHTGFRRLDTNY